MGESTLQEIAPANGLPVKPPHSKPWLAKYRWTSAQAKALLPKAMAAKARNKAIRDELRQSGTNPTLIILDQIKNVKRRLDKPGLTPADMRILVGVLKDLIAMLKPEPAQVDPKPPQSGPVNPLV